jgi:MFS transporter, DHA2 family, multidrug resistance protein
MSAVCAAPDEGDAAKSPDEDGGWTGGRNPWLIAVVVTMATFMEILDTSIANVALPHIAGNLGVGRNESTWVLTSYLVANAVVLPTTGWACAKFGRKRFYMFCVGVFTAASFLCGIAPSIGSLVLFRVLQGVGGGCLGACEQAILVDTFAPAKRGMAMAMYEMAVVLAPAIGPTLGGFITDNLSWRWVFFVNIPIGIASLVLSNRLLSDPPRLRAARNRVGRIDWVGFLLVATGLGLLEFVLDKGLEEDWFESNVIVAATAVAAVSLVSFVAWEWKHPTPLVDVRMFRRRSFVVAALLMVTLGTVAYGSTVLLPQYLQVLMGYTAQQAGLVLSPGGLVIFLVLPLVGRLVSRVDARPIIAVGFCLVSASMFYTAQRMNMEMDFTTAVQLRCVQCMGMACLFVPIQTIAYSGTRPESSSQVSGIMNLARNIGADLGIASVSALLARRRQSHQVSLVAHISEYDAPFRARLEEILKALERAGSSSIDSARRALAVVYRELLGQAMQLAYLDAIWGLAVISAVMAPMVWLAHRPGTEPELLEPP